MLISCNNYRIYRFHSSGSERYCILGKNGQLEHFAPDKFSISYFWNIDAGIPEEERKFLRDVTF